MRHVKVLALCLGAVLVLGVFSATTAWGKETLPAWGKCEPTAESTGGKYINSGCTEKATKHKGLNLGGYEWHPLEGQFNLEPMRLVGALTFETQAGKKIECTEEGRNYSRLIGPSGARTPLWQFEACTSEGEECHSEFGEEPGEISNEYAWREHSHVEGVPNPGWVGQLGFVEGKGTANPVVGFSYTVKNDETLFNPVICKGPIGTVWLGGYEKDGDGFISVIAPVNQMTGEFTETFSESSPGTQSVTKLHGAKKDVIYANLEGHWEPVAIKAVFRDITEEGDEDLEIKATP